MSTDELVATYVGRHAAPVGDGVVEGSADGPRHRASGPADSEGPTSYRPRHRAGERARLQVVDIPAPRGEAHSFDL